MSTIFSRGKASAHITIYWTMAYSVPHLSGGFSLFLSRLHGTTRTKRTWTMAYSVPHLSGGFYLFLSNPHGTTRTKRTHPLGGLPDLLSLPHRLRHRLVGLARHYKPVRFQTSGAAVFLRKNVLRCSAFVNSEGCTAFGVGLAQPVLQPTHRAVFSPLKFPTNHEVNTALPQA